MGVDVIDYTYLQKRGLVKKDEIKAPLGASITKDGFIKLEETSQQNSNESITTSMPAPQSSEGGMFGFLDNPTPVQESQNFFDSPKPVENNLEVNALKLKIEDLEFKLGNLMDKFNQVESKLLNFERKVSR